MFCCVASWTPTFAGLVLIAGSPLRLSRAPLALWLRRVRSVVVDPAEGHARLIHARDVSGVVRHDDLQLARVPFAPERGADGRAFEVQPAGRGDVDEAREMIDDGI